MEAAAGIYTRVIMLDEVQTEQHLLDFQRAMLDATPDCIKVLSLDGKLLMMNKAGCLALNIPEDSKFGMPWLPLLPEDVHPLGNEALRKAAAGHAARFPGKSISSAGITYWDNLLTPILGASGKVLSILCVSRDITAKTLLERQLEEGIDREKLLSREMQHRIKNLFSVVSGLISIAEREAASANASDTATKILRDKLGALSRASDAAFASGHSEGGNAELVSLDAIVRSVLQPYGSSCVVNGNETSIRRDTMTTFALFIHEFATNSVKYGALSGENGHVTVGWTTNGETLNLTWTEAGGPDIPVFPGRQGFGTEMVDRLVRIAGGTINRAWQTNGLVIGLELPGFARN